MTVWPEEPYQPLAPISGDYHPLHGYADEGLLGYQELPAPELPVNPEPPAPPPARERPLVTTLERLLRRRRAAAQLSSGTRRSEIELMQ